VADEPIEREDAPEATGAEPEPAGCVGSLVTAAALLLLLAVLVFGLPIEFIIETLQIARLSARTGGTIAAVAGDDGAPGGPGSTAAVEYTYEVAGRRYTGRRYMPGRIGPLSPWTRGRRVAQQYRVGQGTVVHYDPDEPAFASLRRGWLNYALTLPMLVWGFLLYLISAGVSGRHERVGRILWVVALTMVIGGALGMLLAPAVIALADAPLYLASLAGIGVLAAVVFGRRSDTDNPIERAANG
jgi:hypothetical protein